MSAGRYGEWGRAIETFDAFEGWRDSADVIEQAGGALAQMEFETGLKASPKIEAQIEHHKRAYVRDEIELDELELRIERLLRGERAQTDYVAVPPAPSAPVYLYGAPEGQYPPPGCEAEAIMVPRRDFEQLAQRVGRGHAIAIIRRRARGPLPGKRILA
jgi:hypothetical protein